MKGIKLCGECSDYDWKKHKCRRANSIETDPRNPFYDDCPLPDVAEIIKCKDCKHFDTRGNMSEGWGFCNKMVTVHKNDWFCADGEGRNG